MNTAMRIFVTIIIALVSQYYCAETTSKWPTIFIAVLARNKAYILPYFFSSLEQINYPKDRIMLWIQSDHNEDNTADIIHQWEKMYGNKYHNVNVTILNSDEVLHEDEQTASHWSSQHFRHVVKMRESALQMARSSWADFILMLDADVIFTNTTVMKALVQKHLPLVAPMLISDGLYSNFWCGMTDDYYYMRTDEYKPILSREEKGCFKVPMIHSAVLMDLRLGSSDQLTYVPGNIKDYDGPEDDIIAFAINAMQHEIPLHICNDNLYGFIPVPLEDNADLETDYEQVLNVKLEALSRGQVFPLTNQLAHFISYPSKWKFNCDEIYFINLERRIERRTLMEQSFKELGMDVKHFVAVDGRELDLNDLKGISLMPGYEDPYHKRPMKAGEVGCFLSHYKIWEEILVNGYKTTLVLEDDIHFVPYFRHKFLNLLKEIDQLEWDLVYIGRKMLMADDEVYVTSHVVKPLYSYWTLGYLISAKGAKKLIDANPLSKMLPVDEFLPIMFNQHPNETWKSYFEVRNLAAYSASPLLVHPTHYTGQPGYISDTEDSGVMPSGASEPTHALSNDEL